MALPLRIVNQLALGNAVAAEVKAQLPDHRAWVYVKPIMASGTTFNRIAGQWTRTREARDAYDSTINGYQVRYVELTDWHLAWGFDLDVAIQKRPIVDEEEQLPNEEVLEQWLSARLLDISALRSPGAVGFPNPPPV